MELQAFEVQVCAKAETRGLEMAFLVKVPLAVVSVISQLFHYWYCKKLEDGSKRSLSNVIPLADIRANQIGLLT